MGVGGCTCSNSSTVTLAGMACRELMKRAPISASAAEDITFLMIYATFNTAPLSVGSLLLSKRKK